MFRIVRHRLPSCGRGRHRLVACDCFDLVPLPAFIKTAMPEFNLIIAVCALQYLFHVRDFCVSTHGQHTYESQPLLNLPCSVELSMDIFNLILWERSRLFRAEKLGTPHHKAH